MRNMGRGAALAVSLAMLLGADVASASDNNPNGIVFRAVGWWQGRGQITPQNITCEIPTVSSAIADGAFSFGMWNTHGVETLFFPDPNNPFGNPCGGWIQLQNNLVDQAIQLDHVEMRYKIRGASRFRQFVPARKGFPVACREFRRDTIFVGSVINPINSTVDQSGSGRPNVAFIQLVPMVTPAMIHCLRDQYAALPTSLFVSFPIVIRGTAVGFSDLGDTYRANTIAYHLTLRHTCGNGRIDDGEQCDPNAPDVCRGFCVIPSGTTTGTCSNDSRRLCRGDLDCQGVCQQPVNPTECLCVY